MKKFIAILMAAAIAASMAACAKDDGGKDSDSSGESKQEDTVKIADSLELLETVWNSYGDDEKFSAAGGDMSEENMTMDAPGVYGLEDAEAVDATLGLPAASVDKIDDAASLVHMMNANTFTCGAYHVKDEKDIPDLAAALKDNIMARQWMCGFPDKLVIVSVDSYVVSFFGNEEIVDQFRDKLTGAYQSASVISEDPIV